MNFSTSKQNILSERRQTQKQNKGFMSAIRRTVGAVKNEPSTSDEYVILNDLDQNLKIFLIVWVNILV